MFEKHEHIFTSGPRHGGGYRNGKWDNGHFTHSHPGGDVAHQHAHTGPGCYTIDKDDWFRSTGLRGGGRKKFTKRPSGEQFPVVDLEEWQKSFVVVIGPRTPEQRGEGPGIAPAARMVLGCKMRIGDVVEE